MDSNQIKNLEKELWGAADNLRAESKLTAAEYKDPVLGLILLRFAENRFNETLKQIKKIYPPILELGKKKLQKTILLDLQLYT